MSTLSIDEIRVPNKKSITVAILLEGIARVMCNYNQITPAIAKSVGISSVTDNGTGLHDYNVTSAFTGQYTYQVGGCSSSSGTGNFAGNNATSARYDAAIRNLGSGALGDISAATMAARGDLA